MSRRKLLVITISVLLFVNIMIDLFGIYVPMADKFPLWHLLTLMGIFWVVTLLGAGLNYWFWRDVF